MLSALAEKEPEAEFRVWCDKKFSRQARETMRRVNPSIPVEIISSGKLRRYHTLPLWRQLLRLRTIVLPNIRDSIFIAVGTLQSVVKLLMWRPDVIFCKGGYVCLPVGLAAHWLRIPLVLHDSDAHPGLTNRVLSKWAVSIGTGAPLEHYRYPAQKARYVGIPVDEQFRVYNAKERVRFKEELGFGNDRPLIVVTGGGLGATAINNAVVSVLDELLVSCNVLLISGTGQHAELAKKLKRYPKDRFQLHAFVSKNIVQTLAAADLVIARAGATTLLELAALAKPTIIVPNPYLTGGHQLKNAAVYTKKQAGVVIDEIRMIAEPHELLDTVTALILNPSELMRMSKAIHTFAKPEAARDMAAMVIEASSAGDRMSES